MDRSTVFGIMLAVTSIVAGLVLDGGSLTQILQPAAALIVVVGTAGAVMIQFPAETLIETVKILPNVFLERGPLCAAVMEQLVAYCVQVRRSGILMLDSQLDQIEDLFLRKAFTFAVDGAKARDMRDHMELDLDLIDERESQVVRVLEAAGGFAPTLGIMGAVLGLIQVMQHIDDLAQIGNGIAVAFVSTLYGLALANLLLLPLAGKMRVRLRERQLAREMMIEAVTSIMEGIGPRALKEKLACYIADNGRKAEPIPEPEMAVQ